MTKSKTILPDMACDICGTFFTPTCKQNILCPDCQKHPEQKRKKLEKQIKRSKYLYDTQDFSPKPAICMICKKEFLSYHEETVCNSQVCRDTMRIRSTSCKYCHKPMTETDDQHVTTKYEKWFCSDACKQAYEYQKNKENGYIHTCQQCGKEFIRKTKHAKFCSKECYNKSLKNNTARQETYVCVNCHKQFQTAKRRMFCTPECEQEYNNKHKTPVKRPVNKTTQVPVKKQVTKSLCADCNTPYPDCEYMRSNFRIKPKGAKYENSIIIECPHYTPPKHK